MAEYISREAALRECQYDADGYVTQGIKAIPAADVVPVRHGVWVAIGKTDPRPGYKCSRCNCLAPTGFMGTFVKSNYCPNCGARMDGDGE